MVKVGMAAPIRRFRIIMRTLITAFGWYAVNSAFSMTAVTAFCVSKRPGSNFHRQQLPPLRITKQQTSHLSGALDLQSDRNMSDRTNLEEEWYPYFVFSDHNKILLCFKSVLLLAGSMILTSAAAFAGDIPVTDSGTAKFTVPVSIVSCSSSSTSNSNCVSTASVKQVDLFMLPWTWPESISGDEVIGRLKGVITSDQTLSMVDATQVLGSSGNGNDNYFFRIRAARNVCNDEIEMLINPNDRVITFRSQQVDGPESVSDFGANRRRLEDIRKRLKVVTILGGNDNADYYRNGESSEGLTGQLKAFWGFQSGGGFESILLDDDE